MNIKTKKTVFNDLIDNKSFNTIELPKKFTGNTGYINFLDKHTIIINVENNFYYENNKKITLPTFYDINALCITNLSINSQSIVPKISLLLEKSLTRMAHNICIFMNKDGNSYYGIGGRYDEAQPNRWKNYNITEDKGLYLVSSNKVFNTPWKFLNNGEPIISKDTLSNFKRPASYDSQISCIYSTLLEKYILVVRNNIGREQRYFSVLFSDDCLNWSSFNRPNLQPPHEPKSGNQYYSVLIHEYLPKQIILGFALFYNEKQNIYGIKLLVTTDAYTWKDIGILFELPTGKMPRNHYIRPKIHCGGITSDSNGCITLYFYKYKEKNKVEYFCKTYQWHELVDTI